MAGRRPAKPQAIARVQAPKSVEAATRAAVEPLYQAILDLQARGAQDPVAVTGSKASGAALESLLEALSSLGVIVDNTGA